MTVLDVVVVLLAGAAVGIVSALFGVGGGVLMVPFMVLALDMGQHAAEGTSLLVIVPTALVGTIAHHRNGYVDVPVAARLALGGVAGSILGAVVVLDLSGQTLRRLLAVLVAFVGLRLIRDGLNLKKEKNA
jgi:uncharacterized membrane protein YfcA